MDSATLKLISGDLTVVRLGLFSLLGLFVSAHAPASWGLWKRKPGQAEMVLDRAYLVFLGCLLSRRGNAVALVLQAQAANVAVGLLVIFTDQ